MSALSQVHLRQFETTQIKHLDIIAGISPNAMRRVFACWVLFIAVVSILIVLAPDLSQKFVGFTLCILVAFTFLMFGQSRMAEGWPAIVHDIAEDEIGVVRDPMKREFICVKKGAIVNAIPRVINPNKKAVEIQLDTSLLSEDDVVVLNQAVWPRDNKLIGLAHFKRREDVCAKIISLCNVT